jgi:3alpha(or 20beta)-hydroxysteroid dehydrogenase
MGVLDGKVVVVTGAAGGIGRAASVAAAGEGAQLFLVDLDEAGLAATAEISGGTATVADVTQVAGVERYVAEAVERFGRIDGFFNNAGIHGVVSPIVDYPVETFDRVIAVNLRGVFLGLQSVLRVMLRQSAGSIVNTASIAAARGLPQSSGYIASKHGVLGLTRVAAAEVAALGVRVNAVLPGMIDTQMLRAIVDEITGGDTEAGLQGAAVAAPVARLGSPEEIAAVVVFLLSDASSFVNGAGWPVDGGALAALGNGSPPPEPAVAESQ